MKHGKVYYALVWVNDENGFRTKETKFVERSNARNMTNDLGLDLVTYDGKVHEGRSGQTIGYKCDFKKIIEKYCASEIEALVESSIAQYGLSPRYAQANDKKGITL